VAAGVNNIGLIAGFYTDSSGATHSFLDQNGAYTSYDDPNGTTINGINDLGQLVGFYSDGTNVDGFLATSTPEPASFGLLALAGVLGLSWRLKRKQGRA
jgi:uncharacterized membrane protein